MNQYFYENERERLFTEAGQRMFLAIRDQVEKKLDVSSAVMMGSAIENQSGSSWQMMACVDRMVELGELREIDYGQCAGQHRIFIRGDK